MENLNKIFSKFNFSSIKRFFAFGSSPESDWKIILGTFIFFALLIVGLCTYFFVQLNLSDIPQTDLTQPATSTPTFNITRLRQTLTHYEQKGAEFENVKNTPETVLDPAL